MRPSDVADKPHVGRQAKLWSDYYHTEGREDQVWHGLSVDGVVQPDCGVSWRVLQVRQGLGAGPATVKCKDLPGVYVKPEGVVLN